MAVRLVQLKVSDSFEKSLDDAEQYPQNVIERFTYSATLKAYYSRLDRASRKLFVADEGRTEVAFRDLYAGAASFERRKIRSLELLREHLGVEQGTRIVAAPPAQATGQRIFRKESPKCRFVFIYGDSAIAKLRITRRMAVELLTYHQVMPGYLDFMLLFGQNSRPNDMRFSGFREQTCLKPPRPNQPNALDELKRSGRYFECAYNLKTVQLRNQDEPTSWSVRQAGIYHSFDVIYGTALWIFTKGLNRQDQKHDLKENIEEITGWQGRNEDRKFDFPEACFRSSLAMHAMMLHWATESWRWYLQWLDESIEKETESAVHGAREKGNPGRKWYTAQDIQRIHWLEDLVNEVVTAIQGNMEVITALREYYESLTVHRDWPLGSSCAEHTRNFAKQTTNAVYDLKMQSAMAGALSNHTSERKHLILQYVQAQAAEHMEGLTKSTYFVGASAHKEAIVMRIITAVTLIYLPATFVSTFFSTDVVKYQNQGSANTTSLSTMDNSPASFSRLAMDRWLQISLPLTVVTLAAAYLFYMFAVYRMKVHFQKVLNEQGVV